ncbi:MAG: AsmA family protein [Dokdonella sp.]
MTDREPTQAPIRKRRRRIALVVFVLLLVAAGLFARHLLKPQSLSALLVNQARSQFGIELAFAEPAQFELWPTLHLHMLDPTLRARVDAPPMLGAEAIDVVVPWSTFWSEEPRIDAIELVKPRLDGDALQAWLDARPASMNPIVVPAFHLRIRDGSIARGTRTIADGIELEFAHAGQLGAWLAQWSHDSTAANLVPPMNGQTRIRSLDIGTSHLEGVTITIDDQSPEAQVPAAPPNGADNGRRQ